MVFKQRTELSAYSDCGNRYLLKDMQAKVGCEYISDLPFEVDGYSGFVFKAKSGRPLMPNGVNSVLYNIVDAYNKTEVENA